MRLMVKITFGQPSVLGAINFRDDPAELRIRCPGDLVTQVAGTKPTTSRATLSALVNAQLSAIACSSGVSDLPGRRRNWMISGADSSS